MKQNKGIIGISIIVILLFVVKWPHLSLPMFWDELGVYARAVFHLLDNGVSIMPKAIPPELSRGHPTLFVTLVAGFMTLFGETLIVGHFAALLFATWLLIGVYKMGVFIKNEWTGLFAAGLLLIQSVFIAQSHLILPEILLAGSFIWALYAYMKGNWLQYFIYASVGILTKETAILIPCIVMVSEVGKSLFRLNENKWAKSLPIALTPLLTFGLFLMVQKAQNGWYFFPYHMELIGYSLDEMLKKLHWFDGFLFVKQGRFLWSTVSVLALIWFFRNKINFVQKQWVIVSVVSFLGVLGFTLMNFYMDRYLLNILSILIVLVAFVAVELFERISSKLLKPVFLIGVSLPCLFFMDGKSFNYDVDMGYTDILKVNQMAVDLLATEKYNGSVYANFPLCHTDEDARLGFMSKEHPKYKKIQSNFHEGFDHYFVCDPGAWREYPKSLIPEDTLQYGFAKIIIYKIQEKENPQPK